MKICPSCNRTYADETLNFCLDDGSTLSYSGGPEKRSLPVTRLGGPAPTEILNPGPTPSDSPQSHSTPTDSGRPLITTIQSPHPPQLYSPTPQAPPKVRGTRWGAITIGIGLVLLIAAGIVLSVLWFAKEKEPGLRAEENTNTPVKASPSPSATIADGVWKERYEAASLTGTNLTYYRGTNPKQCEADCGDDERCKGFTFIRPGAYNAADPPMCYLASEVTGASPHSCCISAVKR